MCDPKSLNHVAVVVVMPMEADPHFVLKGLGFSV